MIEVFLFIFRYKILKDETSLATHTKEFFKLSDKSKNKVLDKYFNSLDKNFNIDYYFNSKESRYYENGEELSFFSNYYFCKKIIELNIYNIYLIDIFNLSNNKINHLIEYTIKLINNNNIDLDINRILIKDNILPERLSSNIEFMKYLTKLDIYNIKYITINKDKQNSQRELIKEIISLSKKKAFNIMNFTINKTIPPLLLSNIDFLSYIIENDIENINYIDNQLLENETDTNKQKITNSIMKYLDNNNAPISILEDNEILSNNLNKDYDFINYMINKDVDNIKYVDFHNIPNSYTTKIINNLALKLVKEKIDFDYNIYPFKKLFRQNYMFMAYLIDKDKTNIKDIMVSNKEDVDKLVDIYLNKYRKMKFNTKEYIDDTGYINNYLVENKYMLTYLIRNNNNIFKYIDFLNLNNSKEVVEVILKEINNKTFEFKNESFLVNDRYPIPLSNSYLFMKYVIDKNFNNLAYIDISMIDKKELKRIINYAFRMVYYIRGDNKNLNFDLEGYFKNSMIVENEYFQECLRSL